MNDWNVVVTVYDGGYHPARRFLRRFGPVEQTEYFNILLMRVPHPRQLLELLLEEGERDPHGFAALARVMPIDAAFSFMSAAEFEETAKEVVAPWVPRLCGKRFHVRMHRRGFKGRMSSLDEERFLDTWLLEATEAAGDPARMAFEDPDLIIAVETMGPRAGVSIWSDEELKRFKLLHLD
ncbi:THUMP domain-containing protein [Geomesophilobacter sediminis]|uniref:THUMP domain-containing protein n=1 Tax=Geomesophilobacter sediminis TaxID=2798584 RepID=A0A8J7J0R9_9BACT|nr:THUMP domain-containing protein [Geomesophilobacter sediminis]MBJ6726242.1 hypothetical protein [Geomesophilobacter sediminis]